jgi:hypothetical protein
MPLLLQNRSATAWPISSCSRRTALRPLLTCSVSIKKSCAMWAENMKSSIRAGNIAIEFEFCVLI